MMTSLLTAIAGLAGMGIFYLSWALSETRRLASVLEDTEHSLKQRIQSLEQELAALCSAAVGAGEHVVRLEQQVHRLTERQNQLELRASSERPYSQASQLVNRGANTEELVETCGLTRGEAELLVMMQRGAA
jgi:phage shock protein A